MLDRLMRWWLTKVMRFADRLDRSITEVWDEFDQEVDDG